MSARFNHAFILAAGEGTRMRPFTHHTPKPMAQIGGETLIGRIIHQCRDAGIENLYANVHHLAPVITPYLQERHVHVLHEDVLLNTGLGIKKVLPYTKDEPFYVISGDSWWQSNVPSVFEQMDVAWYDDLDLLLLLQPIDSMTVTAGIGDYHLDNGIPRRALDKEGTYMFTSIRICHPRLFDNTPDEPFSFLEVMDRAEKTGRLGAVVMDGTWQHLSTTADIEAVNTWLEQSHD